MLTHVQELSDKQLVELCLTEEVEAWPEMRRRHVPALVRFIAHQLHGQKSVRCRADDLAELVLESLLEGTRARLRRFDAARATFPAYLRMLAVQAVYRDCRHNKRRGGREAALGPLDPADTWADDAATTVTREEFVASLTPLQQKYCRQELLGETDPAGPYEFSPQQGYNLSQRILKKLKEFCKNTDGIKRGGIKKVRKKRRRAE
jgi:DNA-directed RNA polymerase specialized sigma24 family protein